MNHARATASRRPLLVIETLDHTGGATVLFTHSTQAAAPAAQFTFCAQEVSTDTAHFTFCAQELHTDTAQFTFCADAAQPAAQFTFCADAVQPAAQFTFCAQPDTIQFTFCATVDVEGEAVVESWI